MSMMDVVTGWRKKLAWLQLLQEVNKKARDIMPLTVLQEIDTDISKKDVMIIQKKDETLSKD